MKSGCKRLAALFLAVFTGVSTLHVDVLATGYSDQDGQVVEAVTENEETTEGEIEGATEPETEMAEDTVYESGSCGENATYTLVDGVLNIEGEGKIADSVFKGNDEIKSVVIGENITAIGKSAFYDCDKLETIKVPDKVESIDGWAFYNCDKLKSVELGSGVTSLGQNAFKICPSMTDVTINSNITEGAGTAFDYMNTLTIGENVTEIYVGLYQVQGLHTICASEKSITYSSVDGILYDKEHTKLIRYPQDRSDTSYTVLETVTSIDNSAFRYADSLIEIILPENLTEIGEYAFYYANSLKKIVIPNKVEHIGTYAFRGCTSIKEIYLNNNIADVEEYAFEEIGKNAVLYIGKDVTEINGNVLISDGLKAFSVEDGNSTYSGVDGVLYSKDGTVLIRYPHTRQGDSYAIQETTKVISNSAFHNNGILTAVTVPDGLEKISSYAFYYCDNLLDITIPDSVTEIGEYAFYDCRSLKTARISGSVISIGRYAFGECSNLTVFCEKDSAAEVYALNNKIPYETFLGFMTVTLMKQYTVNPEEEAQIKAESLSNYEVTLENCTTESILENYRINSNGIVLDPDSISAGDELCLKLVSKKGETIALEKKIILDENAKADITLTVCQKGYIGATLQTEIQGSMLIYDESGNLYSVTSIGKGYNKSTYLDPGNYYVVFIEGDSELWNYDHISQFEENGLSEGKEYLLKQATVENGMIYSFENISLIDLDLDDLAIKVQVPESVTEGETITIPVKVTLSQSSQYSISCWSSEPDKVSVESISAIDENGEALVVLTVNTSGKLTLTMCINGRSLYKDVDLTVEKRIIPMDEVEIWDIADQTYTGSALNPNPVILYNGVELLRNTDYTITWKENTEIGIASVIINGIGDYTGTRTETFRIVPLTPYVVDIKTSSEGIAVQWSNVMGVEGYKLYRKADSDSNWNLIGTFDNLTNRYTDRTVESGKTYSYAVAGYKGSVIGEHEAIGKSATYLSCPTVQAANASTGVTVKWNKVNGATGYIVYRRMVDSMEWLCVGTIESGDTLNYTDNTAKSGNTYGYTVRAYKDSLYGNYDPNGAVLLYLTQPAIKVSNSSSGITVKWSKTAGATGYMVYRKAGNASKWSRITTIPDANTLSYVDKNVQSGTNYIYTVKAYKGSVYSTYDKTGVSLIRLSQPTVQAVNGTSGITVKWNKIAGTSGYIVYRKTGNATKWSRITTIKNGSTISYVDKKAVGNGTKYVYTVKAYRGSLYSSYSSSGTTIYRLSVPQITSAKNISVRKLALKWSGNSKATGYQICYQIGTAKKYVTIKGYKNYSRTLTSLTKNKTYKVFVRSYKTVAKKNYYSAWSSAKSVKISK